MVKLASWSVGFYDCQAGNTADGLARRPLDSARVKSTWRALGPADLPSDPLSIGSACTARAELDWRCLRGEEPLPPPAWFVRKGLGPGLLCWARRAPELASCCHLYPSFAYIPSQTGWARRRSAGAMEDEVVRIAKKMDKMVQKKNAVSAAAGANPEGARAAGGNRGDWTQGALAGSEGAPGPPTSALPAREAGGDSAHVLGRAAWGQAVWSGGRRRWDRFLILGSSFLVPPDKPNQGVCPSVVKLSC